MSKVLLKTLLFFFLIGIPAAGRAQLIDGMANGPLGQISYTIMPDSGYDFKHILAGNNLTFVEGDSLLPSHLQSYWLKVVIANPGHFAGLYALETSPCILNTCWYFDANAQKWLYQTVGIATSGYNERTKQMAMNLPMYPQAANIVYIKMDVSRLQKFDIAIKPAVYIQKQATIDSKEKILSNGWLVSFSVLCFLFLSNLYQYFTFRDRAIIYYLVLQVGAMLYITTYRRFISLGVFTISPGTDGPLRYYGLNNLLMHSGILLVIYGVVQLCRSYLNTKKYLPGADAFLKYGMYIYVFLSAALMIVNVSACYLERFTLLYDNIYLLILITAVLGTCVTAYRRRLRASGPFLLAVTVPMAIIVCIPLFYLFVSANGDNNLYIPNLAIISDAVFFSIALVTRTKLIQDDLKRNELESQQLKFDLKEAELRHDLVELENQKIMGEMQNEKSRNGLLQEKLESNQRELTSTALYMVQKNELLTRLKLEIDELNKISRGSNQKELAGLKSMITGSMRFEDDWNKFKLHFEKVHPHFFENLQASHPLLTTNEIRLYAYFHLNLSTKEIALLLNITPKSVRQAKMRLNKKMGHPGLSAHTEEDAGDDDEA